MAILLLAFIGLGIVPGTQMLTNQLDIVFSLVWIVVLGSIVTTIIGIAISPYLARMPNLDPNLMVPIVLAICFIGAYSTRGLPGDVVVCAIFGVLGFVMDKYRFSRANFVIGMVLADMIERSLHLSISLYGEFFILHRPIALTMFVLLVLTTVWPFVRNWRRRRAQPAMS
jgi:TctA family transporter